MIEKLPRFFMRVNRKKLYGENFKLEYVLSLCARKNTKTETSLIIYLHFERVAETFSFKNATLNPRKTARIQLKLMT